MFLLPGIAMGAIETAGIAPGDLRVYAHSGGFYLGEWPALSVGYFYLDRPLAQAIQTLRLETILTAGKFGCDPSFLEMMRNPGLVAPGWIAIATAAAAFRDQAFARLKRDVTVDRQIGLGAVGSDLADPRSHPGLAAPHTKGRIVLRAGVVDDPDGRKVRVEHRPRPGAALEFPRAAAVDAHGQLLDDDWLLALRDLDARLPEHSLCRGGAIGQPAIGARHARPAPIPHQDLVHEFRAAIARVAAAQHRAGGRQAGIAIGRAIVPRHLREQGVQMRGAGGTQVRCRGRSGGRVFRLADYRARSEEHTSELQSPLNLVCRLL